MFENFENSKKILCKTDLFFLTLQACSPEFLTLVQKGSKTNVSFECSEIFGSLPGKCLYNEVIWLTQQDLQGNRFWKFWEISRKTSLVVFKQFKLSNPFTYNFNENWHHPNFFPSVFQEFLKLLGKHLWWNHFLVK